MPKTKSDNIGPKPQMIFTGKPVDGKPEANWPAVYKACVAMGDFVIDIRHYDLDNEITLQQMRWLHARPIKLYSVYIGDSIYAAECFMKLGPGRRWFYGEYEGNIIHPKAMSKKRLTIGETNDWIECCVDFMSSINCYCGFPDPDWNINPDTVRVMEKATPAIKLALKEYTKELYECNPLVDTFTEWRTKKRTEYNQRQELE